MSVLVGTALLPVQGAACVHRGAQDPSDHGGATGPNTLLRAGPEQVAGEFVEALARGDWTGATARFDATMKEAMPEAKLKEVWQDVLRTAGTWQAIERRTTEASGGLEVVSTDLRFSGKRQRFRISVDSDGRIAGFFRGPVPEDAERTAREVVKALASGDGNTAVGSFNARMRAALPPEKAIGAWKTIEDRAGTLREIEGVTARREHGLTIELVRCRLERATIVTKVVFDANGDVAGLFFLSDGAAAEWSPPPYADPRVLEEHDARVGARPTLPGVVTLPRGAQQVPGVVLVHGSGPNDRDETVGATKMFRDLALGLATRGIGVIRYDKRTRVDPRGVITQKEEVLDGALAAVSVLRSWHGIDPQRIVVLGHSQGGALAPLVARLDGALAGIVVLAGPTRSLQTTLLSQLEYLRAQRPDDAALTEVWRQASEFKSIVEAPDLKPDAEIHIPGGGTARGAYFLDLRGYHPEQLAATLGCPALVLQGGRDYQVTAQADFEAWRAALRAVPAATLKLYPALDHRFVAGTGLSSPEQYEEPGHVDAKVVDDIASWVNALSPNRDARLPARAAL